ncbi:MAG: chorismate mutase [Hyphomonadaceae bacterium]|jgi:chorismate mutase|nr:chorismate mutase [Hyphomonadaceae bacterium]
MNDQSPPGSPLETIRAEIDGIDKTLLSLLADRLRAVDKMGGLKPPEHGLPIRPGREVALLRRLVAEAPAPLEREFVVEIWRAMIAASLRRQRVIDVVVGGGRGDPTRLFDIARRHFGARTRIKDLGEPQAALQKAAENPDSVVAVTSWPAAPGVGAWWPALSERRFHNLHIIAGLPLLGGTDEPEAALFAASQTEEAGNDVTILIAFDPHHRLQRALNENGLTGRELARAEPRVLVRVDGFIGLDDPRAAALSRAGLDSVRVLGSYARV